MNTCEWQVIQKVSQKGSPYYVLRLTFGNGTVMELFINSDKATILQMISNA